VHKILENMTTERDLKNQFDYARKEGHAIGMEEGRAEGIMEGQIEACLENARNFKHLGVPIDIICQATGLSSEVVEGL
jgi:predicted transposase/invertase (TIGR01784 family)